MTTRIPDDDPTLPLLLEEIEGLRTALRDIRKDLRQGRPISTLQARMIRTDAETIARSLESYRVRRACRDFDNGKPPSGDTIRERLGIEL